MAKNPQHSINLPPALEKDLAPKFRQKGRARIWLISQVHFGGLGGGLARVWGLAPLGVYGLGLAMASPKAPRLSIAGVLWP